jgi:hypothetical protein
MTNECEDNKITSILTVEGRGGAPNKRNAPRLELADFPEHLFSRALGAFRDWLKGTLRRLMIWVKGRPATDLSWRP